MKKLQKWLLYQDFYSTSCTFFSCTLYFLCCFKYIFSFSKVKKDTHTWEHNDGENCIAGILYLNPDPIDPVMSGTRIADKNVENKFNRLVMYDGSQTHQQNGAWGDDWDDCRLTLTTQSTF